MLRAVRAHGGYGSPHEPDLQRARSLAERIACAVEQAEDVRDVGLGLGDWWDAAAGADRGGARVVGGKGERDRPERAQQVAHEVRLGVDGTLGVERIGEAV